MDNKFSVWKATSESSNFPVLDKDITVDVAIIGGGITGLTCAHLLSESGISVAVLEAKNIGEGTTGYSTGNLYATIDSRLFYITSKYDEETSKKIVESRGAAVDFIEQVCSEYNIECDFERTPWYLFTETENEKATIDNEYKAANKAGLNASLLDSLPLPLKVKSAVHIEGQAQFNPLKYVKSLAKKISNSHCIIFENTRALNFKSGDACEVETPLARVEAKFIILATHTPKGVYAIQSATFPYREDAIAVKLKNQDYPSAGIYWGLTKNHHHSFRTYKTDNDIFLVIAGEHYKTGQAENAKRKFEELEKFARNRFDIEKILYRWAAQSYRSADGLPYIGEIEKKIYTATGFSADGLTYGTLSAMIITDLIKGENNKWTVLYDINRHKPVKAAKGYLKENMNVLKEYMKDLPGVAEVSDLNEIKPGVGKVISLEGEKVAAYKEDDGSVHAVSAVCTHMKCIVHFNNAEKTWDCPCHGSRFKVDGTVIEGPATVDLISKTNYKNN